MLAESKDNKVVGALARLQNDNNWTIVKEWLTESLTTTREQNDKCADDTHMKWGQGCAQTLDTLLKTAEKSPELYRKLTHGR